MPRSKRNLDLPPGATVRMIDPAVMALRPRGYLYPSGMVIADFSIKGRRAVPWSVSRRGTKSPRLVAWQERVRGVAWLTMGQRLPHTGPFKFDVKFQLVRRGLMPDATNALKAVEDACQGFVYLNDNMCRSTIVSFDPDAPVDETRIIVTAL